MPRRIGRGALLLTLALGLASARSADALQEFAARTAPLAAQKAKAASACRWCRDEPARRAAAGALTHGPFEFGLSESAALSALDERFLFLETAHFKLASNLPAAKLDVHEQQRVQPLLDELRTSWPELPRRVRELDPHLRLHVLGLQLERLYARMQSILGVSDADFPAVRDPQKPYMGEGPYLGEKQKFELVLHARRETHLAWCEILCGARVQDALRWHAPGAHKMVASIPAEDGDLRQERWLWPHVAHNVAHLVSCAYKHFSYEPPSWLDEGLALVLEKEIEPESRTFEGEEGALKEDHWPADYPAAARKLLAQQKLPSFAELLRAPSGVPLNQAQSLAAHALVGYLLAEKPSEFARFFAGVKGQLDERGAPTGAGLPELQRRLLLELFGWTPAELDAAARAWLLAQAKPRR